MNPSFQPQIAFKPSRCYSSCGKKNLKRINRAGGVISMRLGEQNHSKLQCHLPLVARQCVGLSEKLRMVGWDMDMACREGAEAPDGHTWFSLNPGAGGIRGAEGAWARHSNPALTGGAVLSYWRRASNEALAFPRTKPWLFPRTSPNFAPPPSNRSDSPCCSRHRDNGEGWAVRSQNPRGPGSPGPGQVSPWGITARTGAGGSGHRASPQNPAAHRGNCLKSPFF